MSDKLALRRALLGLDDAVASARAARAAKGSSTPSPPLLTLLPLLLLPPTGWRSSSSLSSIIMECKLDEILLLQLELEEEKDVLLLEVEEEPEYLVGLMILETL